MGIFVAWATDAGMSVRYDNLNAWSLSVSFELDFQQLDADVCPVEWELTAIQMYCECFPCSWHHKYVRRMSLCLCLCPLWHKSHPYMDMPKLHGSSICYVLFICFALGVSWLSCMNTATHTNTQTCTFWLVNILNRHYIFVTFLLPWKSFTVGSARAFS